MKKFLLSLSVIGLFAFTACEKKEAVAATEAEEVATASEEATAYKVDTLVSNVGWRGFKIYEGETEEQGHYGIIKLSNGEIQLEDNKIVAGNFTIDVTTLESNDLDEDPEQKAKLDGHLKSEDFLHVEKYPTATFSISEVNQIEGEYNTEIKGNLKLREEEKNIAFNANVVIEGDEMKINSEEFPINRQDFGVSFKGTGVVIKDNVHIKVNLVAKAAAEANETEEATETTQPAEETEA